MKHTMIVCASTSTMHVAGIPYSACVWYKNALKTASIVKLKKMCMRILVHAVEKKLLIGRVKQH